MRLSEAQVRALLDRPLKSLRRPLPIASSLLEETIWLVAHADQPLPPGVTGVTYTPGEVKQLLELQASVDPAVWPERLRLLHAAKREFKGRLVRSDDAPAVGDGGDGSPG